MTTATNGLEAFRAVKEHLKDKTHYSIIVLDLNMPEMGGLEAAELIT